MSTQMKLDIAGLPTVAAAMKAIGPAILDHMETASYESTMLLEREVKEATPTGAHGILRQSIGSKVVRIGRAGVDGYVSTPLAYAVPVELGSKPHFPPVQPLIDWAVSKLGKSEKEARKVGFAIAIKISKKGTKGAFMFTDTWKENKPQVEGIYERHAEAALDEAIANNGGSAS